MKTTIIQNSDVTSKDLSSCFQVLSENCQDNHIVQINVSGNLWEPLFRWMNADSRVFRDQPASVNRVTVGDLLSLGEIYGFCRFIGKLASLLLLKLIGYQYRLEDLCRKLPIIKHFGVNISLTLYKSSSSPSGSNQSVSIVFPAKE